MFLETVRNLICTFLIAEELSSAFILMVNSLDPRQQGYRVSTAGGVHTGNARQQGSPPPNQLGLQEHPLGGAGLAVQEEAGKGDQVPPRPDCLGSLAGQHSWVLQ